ncbi:Crp/Fnr family transcriptional regulator [Ferruginivarius sediminum]|uniref:Crp/Fnr family transcriptional regulator n=1 Tax=Ferruginivarius sediminum TaxID=2661937 RepID=A0A369T7C5_9PROT|nr:Crp/Fnr family transcriptional regulator [Ferruginivarius sediminum]RDD61231.1 Crp/Fnr family transcriptional regulator [Ferruginivarius sediminum]
MNLVDGGLLARRLAAVVDLSQEDRELLAALETQPTLTKRGHVMIAQGREYADIGVLLSGWGLSTKDLPNGRRQVIDFLLPGSVLGWQGTAFRVADHGVVALTDVIASWFSPQRLVDVARSSPTLGMVFNWLVLREHAVVVERVTSLGQRSARERLVHLLLELWRRLRSVGLLAEAEAGMPVSQAILAEATGLSPVHVNRSLQDLVRQGLIAVRRQAITLLDLPGLERVALYDDTYLHESPFALSPCMPEKKDDETV